MNQLVTIFLGTTTLILGFFVWRFFQETRNLRTRYSGITDLEAELTAAKSQIEQTKRDQREYDSENERRRAHLSQEYEQALAKYKELKKEVSLLEENLEDISFGLYKPHFSFQASEDYRTALENLRNRERQLIRDGRASVSAVQWTVSNSARKGERMVKQYTKLLLRAFNGECDAAVANVSWNNITKMEERVHKSFEAVNRLGGEMQMSVTQEFLKLKLDELRLTHEYEEKRYQEREEQRRIREQIREEERAQREIEKAQEEAEQEEVRYQKALEKARAEAALATGAQLEKLTEQIRSFESKLDEARTIKERAVSRAQLTKSGFVYVISNVGSFGERVYKIGLTRRLEPMERVYELGDASVPFPFDLHAMLYSDNAPELENSLHQLLEERRFNLVNPRREFYRDVELEEIEAFVRSRGLSAQFIKHPEAREYRETLAVRQKKAPPAGGEGAEKFLPSLFGNSAASGDSMQASSSSS